MSSRRSNADVLDVEYGLWKERAKISTPRGEMDILLFFIIAFKRGMIMSIKMFLKNNKHLFIIDGCIGTAIYILTNGTILSGYAYFLGASESMIGIIATLPVLLNGMQIISARVLQSRSRNKKLIVGGLFIHRFAMGCMFMLPFLNIASEYKVALLALSYGFAYGCYDFIATGLGNWMLHSVEPKEVGRFLGRKDSLSLAVMTATSLVAARMLDYFEAREIDEIGFMIVGIAIMVMSIMNYVDLHAIEEVETPVVTAKQSILRDIMEPFQDQKFRKVMGFYGLWNIALYIANALGPIYMVGYLELEYFFIMLVSMLNYISRIISANIWGKLADRISWIWVNRWSVVVLALSTGLWIFVGKDNYMWLLPVIQILAGTAWGGIVISVFNIQYLFAPSDNKVLFVSINTALTSVIGFGAAFVGVRLMEIFPTISVGDITVQGLQWVLLLSTVLMVCVSLYSKKYLES